MIHGEFCRLPKWDTVLILWLLNYLKLLWTLSAAAAKSLHLCPTVRPHRRQPTRLPRSWDSPGKNTGVGCHFLLQCVKVKRENEVAQSCLTLGDPMDQRLPSSSFQGIFQARVLEWGAIAFSVGPSLTNLKSKYRKGSN